MRTARNREGPVVVGRDEHPAELRADCCGSRRGEIGGIDERGTPCACDMALRTVLRKRRRRSRPAVARVNIRIEIVGRMAGKAVALDRSPLPFVVAYVTLGAVGERMHPGEREPGPPMELERPHVVPSARRVTARASAVQTRLVRVLMTTLAFASDTPLTAVTLVARSRCVSTRERKPGSRMVEALPGLPSGHVPAIWGVAVSAIHAQCDRVVTGCARAIDLLAGLLGDRHRRDHRESGHAEQDACETPHRAPFLRACGFA